MGSFENLFEQDHITAKKAPEHGVVVTLYLSNDGFGTKEEFDQIQALSDEMEKAILAVNAGEFDGDLFGQGECRLYMYGPNADQIQSAIEPILKTSPLARGATLMKRYGDVSDLAAHEEMIQL